MKNERKKEYMSLDVKQKTGADISDLSDEANREDSLWAGGIYDGAYA